MDEISGRACMRIASNSLPFRLQSAAPAGLGRRFATALIFAAFLLQSIIAQTHIHPGPGSGSNIVQMANKTIPQVPALPGNSDEAVNCPLCQTIVHAGAYFLPAVLDMLVPYSQNASPPVIAARDMRIDYRGHRKQQRGPPSI